MIAGVFFVWTLISKIISLGDMLTAVSRLLFIFVMSVLCCFLAVFALRNVGMQAEYPAIVHPILDDRVRVIAAGGDLDHGPAHSESALNGAPQDCVLGLKLQLTNDGKWIVYGSKTLDEFTTGTGFVGQYSSEQLKSFRFLANKEPLLFLDEVLKIFPNRIFFIEIIQPGGVALTEFLKVIESANAIARVIVSSPYLDTVAQLRVKNYQWLTAAAISEVSKSQLLSSLYLETTMSLPGDVFIAPKYLPRLFKELFHRKKIVVLPVEDAVTWSAAVKAFPDLWAVTDRPGHFGKQLLDP